MRKSRVSLVAALIFICVLGIVDMTLSLISINDDKIYLIVLSLLDGCIFSILTLILVFHTVVLYVSLRSFRTGVVKDKCLIATMSSLFTISYGSRCVYLLVQGVKVIESEGEITCDQVYRDNVFFLSLLPLFDFLPIIAIFLFHIIKFVFAPAAKKRHGQSKSKTRKGSRGTKGTN